MMGMMMVMNMVMMVMVIVMLFFFISTTVSHYFILMAYDLNVKVQPVSKYEQKPGKEEDGGKYGAKIIRQPKRERDGTPHIKVPGTLISDLNPIGTERGHIVPPLSRICV